MLGVNHRQSRLKMVYKKMDNILSGILSGGLVLGLARILFIQQVKRIDEVEKEQNLIKTNYISQFGDVKELIGEVKISIARLEERLPKKRK